MPLLPESYKPVEPSEWPMDVCPRCEGELCHPKGIGKSIVGVHQAWYRCLKCKMRWAVRYMPDNYSSCLLVECLDAKNLDYRPLNTQRHLQMHKAP